MKLSIASVFTDNMVLQRGMPVPIWGQAEPGSRIIASIHNRKGEAVTNAQGTWKIVLDPLEASSEPTELAVGASNGAKLYCRNVLVGEVWVCSGQSNMEWSVQLSANGDKEIAAADYPAIRLFTVPRTVSMEPVTQISGAAWTVCSPATIASFSAVGYFFGRELYRRLGVPIGLINCSYGGTPAEAWTSREALMASPAVRSLWEDYCRESPNLDERQAQWEKKMKSYEDNNRDTENKGFPRGFAGIAEPDGNWEEMEIPGHWQKRGLEFSGILWFRKVVDIPPAWEGKDLQLSIGATDKSDITYFNNHQVGSVTMQQREDAWSFQRAYRIPAELVKSGRSLIAVRVHSDKYDGGMTGPAPVMRLTCPSRPKDFPIALAGAWRYFVEANYGKVPRLWAPAGPDNPSTPTTLFNGMIAPLIPFAVQGAIWYQGESNADRADQYRSLFPVMIRDWRRNWSQSSLAFYFVQLANHMGVSRQPTESSWAELREAQRMTLQLPDTGMAVAIDVGDADDIHPQNKQDVGLRLAFNALHYTYGLADVPPCGPLFRKAVLQDGEIHLSFDHAEDGLVCRGDKLKGFAVAGSDRTFVWCDGQIVGDKVILTPGLSNEPRYVRYAWANNPVCNLYRKAGLPAAPFQGEIES